MASKSSRWAVDDNAEDFAAAAQRKREKEERRRLKEERARRAAETTQITVTATPDDRNADGDTEERPSKRRRTASPSPSQPQQQPVSVEDTTTLLEYPRRSFGPAASVDQYTILNPIEEGSYGHVSRAKSNTGDVVALKKLKMDVNQEGFPVTALREIQTLRACSHPHIVTLREVVMGQSPSE